MCVPRLMLILFAERFATFVIFIGNIQNRLMLILFAERFAAELKNRVELSSNRLMLILFAERFAGSRPGTPNGTDRLMLILFAERFAKVITGEVAAAVPPHADSFCRKVCKTRPTTR